MHKFCNTHILVDMSDIRLALMMVTFYSKIHILCFISVIFVVVWVLIIFCVF